MQILALDTRAAFSLYSAAKKYLSIRFAGDFPRWDKGAATKDFFHPECLPPAAHQSIRKGTPFSPRPAVFCLACLQVLLALAVFCHWKISVAEGDERGWAAVLPFRLLAREPLESPARDMQEMVTLGMEKRGYRTISPQIIARNSAAHSESFDLKDILAMGRELKVDWIVMGTITQVGKRIDLDLKAVDIADNRAPISAFTVAESPETLGEAADRLVASIDNQILGASRIVSVRVTGNHRIEKEAILAVVRAEEGDMIDSEELDNDLRNIYRMGFFTDVKVHISMERSEGILSPEGPTRISMGRSIGVPIDGASAFQYPSIPSASPVVLLLSGH